MGSSGSKKDEHAAFLGRARGGRSGARRAWASASCGFIQAIVPWLQRGSSCDELMSGSVKSAALLAAGAQAADPMPSPASR